MKKLDQNQKIVVIALVIFVAFLVGFSVLSGLVQSEIMPDFTASQRVQGILAFFCLSWSMVKIARQLPLTFKAHNFDCDFRTEPECV